MKPEQNKFSFSIDFQFELLRYLIQSKESTLIIKKVKPGYFTLIEHALIMESLLKFYKKYGKIPSKPMMIESCKSLLESKNYADLIIKDDVPKIHKLIEQLYTIQLKDSDAIQDNIYKYIAYVEIRSLNESMDFSNFSLYENYQNKVVDIIRKSKPQTSEDPLFMVAGVTKRQLMRKVDPDVIPTPYWQLNDLFNGGGASKGSIFVLLDKPKAKKTFALINIARGYLTMKKNVLYIDVENGKNQIMERMVQSTLNKTKKELLGGEYDSVELRHMRKYKRLGVEFVVERVSALVDNVNTIRSIIQKLELDRGIKIHILMVDYAGKLASLDNEKEDVNRINNVYIELDNLAKDMGIEHIWTAQHVTREGGKHKSTRYEDNDIASSISIIRNAQCIIGLNSTDEEEANNIQRMEIVVQRDGKPYGRCLFNTDMERQRWKEFSKEARAKYDSTVGDAIDKQIKKSSKNPVADADKAKHKGGDI